MLDEEAIKAHRDRALTPDRPILRGTAQNPDTFFQAREACNKFYDACPGFVQEAMDQFGKRIGRKYHLFDYIGAPDADRVIVVMGSGSETVTETVEYLNKQGAKLGVLIVRLFRPFSAEHLVKALPKTVKAIAVLDRTKEPGALGEPLYLDVVAALREMQEAGVFAGSPKVIGGRYGLSSKEFTPAMAKAVFDELAKAQPKNHFTVGINDDVTHLSLPMDESFDIEPDDVVRAVFFGLGADGTVGANKNSIKIIGEETDNYAQGYFVYDSKKSGAVTISHLRFGPRVIRSPYLINRASFVACHQFVFLEKYDVLSYAREGATFLLNAPYGKDEIWGYLPKEVQEAIIAKKLKFYVIDGYEVAKKTGMGSRVNTIMQTCFFAISGVLPREEAIAKIKYAIQKTYGKKGEEVVKRNFAAVDDTLAHLHEVKVPAQVTATRSRPPIVSDKAPDFVKRVTAVMMAGAGRQASGQRIPGRRDLRDGHDPVGKAEHRPGSADLGSEHLHPVQQVRDGLSARGGPGEGVRCEPAGRRSCGIPLDGLQGQGIQGHEVLNPGGPGGLHRVPTVRERVPGEGQVEPEAQSDQHGAGASDPGSRDRELLVLPVAAGSGPDGVRSDQPEEFAVLPPAVRVLGRVRRLRRNAVREADVAVVRRPVADRQRDGLLVDLRRQPADDPVLRGRQRARPVVEQLAVRGRR